MANLRSTYQLLKDRKKILEDTLKDSGMSSPAPAAKSDPDDLLSPAALEAEYQKQKGAKKKKGWW